MSQFWNTLQIALYLEFLHFTAYEMIVIVVTHCGLDDKIQTLMLMISLPTPCRDHLCTTCTNRDDGGCDRTNDQYSINTIMHKPALLTRRREVRYSKGCEIGFIVIATHSSTQDRYYRLKIPFSFPPGGGSHMGFPVVATAAASQRQFYSRNDRPAGRSAEQERIFVPKDLRCRLAVPVK
uniref:Putative secreted protein n=1 Tax=Anopheles darlingi TaxID=43151 RepID=A0A2M4DMQ7_ANODA